MKSVAELTETALNRLLPSEDAYPPSIHRLMRYSIFAGGKRIRPCLIMAAYEACGEFSETAFPSMSALPSRCFTPFRSFTTIFPAWTTTISGAESLPLTAHSMRRLPCSAATPLHHRFRGAGSARPGRRHCRDRGRARHQRHDRRQVVDLESEGKIVNRHVVEYIHEKKTAALIRACVIIGPSLLMRCIRGGSARLVWQPCGHRFSGDRRYSGRREHDRATR